MPGHNQRARLAAPSGPRRRSIGLHVPRFAQNRVTFVGLPPRGAPPRVPARGGKDGLTPLGGYLLPQLYSVLAAEGTRGRRSRSRAQPQPRHFASLAAMSSILASVRPRLYTRPVCVLVPPPCTRFLGFIDETLTPREDAREASRAPRTYELSRTE
jgi:hypothetical protein